jgi:hypothetical protein
MSTVFVGQDLLNIRLETGYDLSQASLMKVIYKKPSGIIGEWSSNITYDDTVMIYDVQDGNIDENGSWLLQPYIEVAGQKTWGVAQKVKFINPIQ